MSTATFDAIDMALLALIGVVTPLICVGGIGWAYRMEERGSAKKPPGAGRYATEHSAEQGDAASKSARRSDVPASAGAATGVQRARHRVGSNPQQP